MPNEGSRITARKTVILPSGDTIKVPVITQISFVDPFERHQETEHHIDNSDQSNRVVHVDAVHSVDVDENGVPTEEQPAVDTAESLYVERIDTWNAVDPFERHQETQLSLDNRTGNDLVPPHFSTHERTHIYRYHQDPNNPDDDGAWIDSELIDEFTVLDPLNRGQETHYILTNPTNEEFRAGDLSGQADATDPDLTIGDGSGEGTQGNPVRLDPFQNIVNYSSGNYVVIVFEWAEMATNPLPEFCYKITLAPTFAIDPGVEPVVTPVSIVVAYNEIRSGGRVPLSPDPVAGPPIESGLFADGYEFFGPTCPACGFGNFGLGPNTGPTPQGCTEPYISPPPGSRPVHYFTDPTPQTAYTRTFLFDASASDPSSVTPARFAFDISGIPSAKDSADLSTITDAGGLESPRNIFQQTSGLRFHAYVFKKSEVDLYLLDPAFPLRKKGISPTGELAVDQTKQISTATTRVDNPLGWVGSGGDTLTETFDPTDDPTSDPTAASGSVQMDLRFEKIAHEQTTQSVIWPETPDVRLEQTYHFELTAPFFGGNTPGWVLDSTGDTHVRTYSINQSGESFVFEVDFGTRPFETTTA